MKIVFLNVLLPMSAPIMSRLRLIHDGGQFCKTISLMVIFSMIFFASSKLQVIGKNDMENPAQLRARIWIMQSRVLG